MKITFVQTPCYELYDDRLEPPLGSLYLATYLNQFGYDADIVDLSSIPKNKWKKSLPISDIYGFSSYTTTYYRTLDVKKIAKEVNPDSINVAGGPHASALSCDVSKDFDFVVIGEGEKGILKLCDYLKNGKNINRIIQEPPIENLDEIPFPDYSLVDLSSYHRIVGSKPSISILSARGCPYKCNYCNSIIMGGHRRVRFRSAENVAEEIRDIKERYGITSFRFQDDTFTVNLLRMRKLTKLLKPLDIIYRCFGRVDRCSKEMTDLLYEGGCRHVSFGVESGSPRILELMERGQTVEDIKMGISNAKGSGLMVRVYLIVGYPGETWKSINQTVDLMLECMPHEFAVYALIPYPGTPLYHHPEKFGITEINKDFSKYFQIIGDKETGYVFRTKDLDENKIKEMRTYVMEKLSPHMIWAGESKEFR